MDTTTTHQWRRQQGGADSPILCLASLFAPSEFYVQLPNLLYKCNAKKVPRTNALTSPGSVTSGEADENMARESTENETFKTPT